VRQFEMPFTTPSFEGNGITRGAGRCSRDDLGRRRRTACPGRHMVYERVRGQYEVDRSRIHVGDGGIRAGPNPKPRRSERRAARSMSSLTSYAGRGVPTVPKSAFGRGTIAGVLGEREALQPILPRVVAKAIIFSRIRELIPTQRFGGRTRKTTSHPALIRLASGRSTCHLSGAYKISRRAAGEGMPSRCRSGPPVLIQLAESANVTEWCKKEACLGPGPLGQVDTAAASGSQPRR